MPPKGHTKYDPEAVAYAVAEVAKGRSYREVAEELVGLGVDVSHMTVKRWSQAKKDDGGSIPPADSTGASVAAGDGEWVAEPVKSVARKIRQRGGGGVAKAAPPPPELEPPTPADPESFDYEATLLGMLRDAQAEAKAFTAASNPKAAQTAMRRASELMKVLAQSEKRKPADPDVLSFSRKEIEEEWARLEGTLRTLCERPVLCSACSRELSVAFGRGQV
jgi:hypothetical protein